MKEFIYEKDNSISKEMCNDIVFFMENSNIRNNNNLLIDASNTKNNTFFYPIINSLQSEIKNCVLNEYLKLLNNYNIHFIESELFFDEECLINQFTIHDKKLTDSSSSINNNFVINCVEQKYSVFKYFWYLNDVQLGGETFFFDSYKIAPKQGKLVIFPAEWFFVNKDNYPLSNYKYILSGLVYY